MKTPILASLLIIISVVLNTSEASVWSTFNVNNSDIPSNTVTALERDGNGTWVGTDNGLSFFDGTSWTNYDQETSALPDNNIHDIERDDFGNTWIATEAGLLQISDNGWEVLTKDNSGLPSNSIRSVTTDSEGNLWVGTWGAGVAFRSGTHWTVYNTDNSPLPSNGVFCVEVDTYNQKWIGTYNGGVSKLYGQLWTTYDSHNSPLPHDHVRSVSFEDGKTWFGTDDGLASLTSEDAWDVFNHQTIGISFHTVFNGVKTSDGQLYFATDGGILKVNPRNFQFFTVQNSEIPSNNIRSLEVDENENILVGTSNAGLSLLQTGSVDVATPNKENGNMEVFPNPSNGEIGFLLPNKDPDNFDVTIINGHGQAVASRKITYTPGSVQRLNVEHLNTGIYFLHIRTSNSLHTKQFYKL